MGRLIALVLVLSGCGYDFDAGDLPAVCGPFDTAHPRPDAGLCSPDPVDAGR